MIQNFGSYYTRKYPLSDLLKSCVSAQALFLYKTKFGRVSSSFSWKASVGLTVSLMHQDVPVSPWLMNSPWTTQRTPTGLSGLDTFWLRIWCLQDIRAGLPDRSESRSSSRGPGDDLEGAQGRFLLSGKLLFGRFPQQEVSLRDVHQRNVKFKPIIFASLTPSLACSSCLSALCFLML